MAADRIRFCVRHVGRDDDRHDDALSRADDPHLRACRAPGSDESQPFASTAWFAGGYLLAWTAFSLAATSAQWALERAALLTPMMASASKILGGVLLIARRALSMDTAEGRLLVPVPGAAWVHLEPRRLPRDATGALMLGLRHGALLSRMLLGADGSSVCRSA